MTKIKSPENIGLVDVVSETNQNNDDVITVVDAKPVEYQPVTSSDSDDITSDDDMSMALTKTRTVGEYAIDHKQNPAKAADVRRLSTSSLKPSASLFDPHNEVQYSIIKPEDLINIPPNKKSRELDSLKVGIKPRARTSSNSAIVLKSQPNREYKVSFESPAKEWETKKMIKQKNAMTKDAKDTIKAGWRVRQAVQDANPPGNADAFYLESVQNRNVCDITALFSLLQFDKSIVLNKEAKNQHGKRALKLALDNCDIEMCDELLKNKVEIQDCLFYAIQIGSLPGVEVIVKHKKSKDMAATVTDYHFPCRITPILLAGYHNNYEILEFLFDKGHQLGSIPSWEDGIEDAWESAQERRMYFKATSSPAYITLMHNKLRVDPMEYCMEHIVMARKNAHVEHEFNEYYNAIAKQLEDYMCSLLDQVRCSRELAKIFEFKINKTLDGSLPRSEIKSRFYLLDRACELRLTKFVSHHNAQLSLAYMRYRYFTFFRKGSALKRGFLRFLVGTMYPLFSLFYIIAPQTALGSLITVPTVSFDCHIMSDVGFIALLVLNICLKSTENSALGAKPTVLEWLIFVWILGRFVQELEELTNRGPSNYVKDWWNYNDIFQLILFGVAIVLRIISYGYYNSASSPYPNPQLIPRSEWNPYELRLISEGLTSWAYVFVFLRVLGISRADRIIGPLQISLSKMIFNVLQFLSIFVLIMFSFGLGLSELYWYYGTEQGRNSLCERTNTTATCEERPIMFRNIFYSMLDLFWALFGHIDLDNLSLTDRQYFTEIVGRTLIASYHVVAIIVLLNMLIAMMSKSYEDTSANEENEWKFHRTTLWIRFIRREVIRPPPMNLFPNPYRYKENWHRLMGWVKKRTSCSETTTANIRKSHDRNGIQVKAEPSRTGYHFTVDKLANRYKFKELLSNQPVKYEF